MNWIEGFPDDIVAAKVETVLFYIAQDAEQIQSSRHAAAIVVKNKIIATGEARYKTHPMQARYQTNPKRIYLHAEVDAIVRCINLYGSEILKEADLYVLRLSKGGTISMSRPCEGCVRAINAFGIQNIYWSNS